MIIGKFSLKKTENNKLLMKVKSGLAGFSLQGFCINNKINSAEQTIFR